MRNPSTRRSRRLVDRLVAPYVNGLAGHMARVQESILDLHARVGWIEDRLRELPEREQRDAERLEQLLERAAEERREAADKHRVDRQMLREIYERADEQRRRLYE